MDHYMIDK